MDDQGVNARRKPPMKPVAERQSAGNPDAHFQRGTHGKPSRSMYEEQYERQREHAKTPEAVMGRVLRGIVAEGTFGEAVRHGLTTMRSVGNTMAVRQSQLVAAMLNFTRLLRVKPVNALA